jgi:flavin reductase (DIM6/NTAB) family NADH-FMN oxidoreductase RutF
MSVFHFYEPKDGRRLPQDPFKAIVAPRPIGWISTVDREGRVNLAPYSFFNAFCDFPPITGFSSSHRKDSQRNVEETDEFVFSLATKWRAEAMNRTSAPLPHGVNEFGADARNLRIVSWWKEWQDPHPMRPASPPQ